MQEYYVSTWRWKFCTMKEIIIFLFCKTFRLIFTHMSEYYVLTKCTTTSLSKHILKPQRLYAICTLVCTIYILKWNKIENWFPIFFLDAHYFFVPLISIVLTFTKGFLIKLNKQLSKLIVNTFAKCFLGFVFCFAFSHGFFSQSISPVLFYAGFYILLFYTSSVLLTR